MERRIIPTLNNGKIMKQKSYVPKKADLETPDSWYLVDADGQVLGRLASQVAQILRGKHKPTFTPFLDCGDHVVVVNADKVVLSGRKPQQKIYYHHSNYPSGLRRTPYEEMLRKHPERVIIFAVQGMLPRNRLGKKLLRKLRVYAGPGHPHQAQNPQSFELTR